MAYNTNAYVKVGTSLHRVNLSTHWNMIDGKPTNFTPTAHNHDYLPLSGGELTGNLKTTSVTNTYYASNVHRFFTTATPVETVIYTKIKYLSGTHMPVIRLYGYAYGLNSPIELKIGFYIYGGNLGWSGAVSMGAWRPNIRLFKYTEGGADYVALGLMGAVYFLGFQVDVQSSNIGTIGNSILTTGWSSDFRTQAQVDASNSIIPAIGINNCISVEYKSTINYLQVKFNGTNQFYYDGTNYQTLNITPAAIGALGTDEVSSWAKAQNPPTYNQDDVGDGTTYKRVTQTDKNTWNAKEPAISKTENGLLRVVEGAFVIDTATYLTTIPTASASVLGGIKVGTRLSISNGVLSANSQTDNNFTTTLKNKLDGIATGATNVVESTVSGWGFTKNAGTVTGTGAANGLAFWTGTNSIDVLGTATYPSLTELSHVKGVTSAIQTQLNGKLSTAGTAYDSTRFGGKQLRVGSYTSGASGYITMGY